MTTTYKTTLENGNTMFFKNFSINIDETMSGVDQIDFDSFYTAVTML